MADPKPAARDAASLVLRLCLGAIFVFSGAHKLGLLDPARSWTTTVTSVGNFATALTGMGISPAKPLAWATALTEFLGGAFVLLGFLTRLSSLGLIVVMAVAIAKVHLSQGFMACELPMIIAGAALALVLTGPGGVSMDALFSKIRSKKKPGGGK